MSQVERAFEKSVVDRLPGVVRRTSVGDSAGVVPPEIDNAILLETGDFLMTEGSDNLVLESA